MGDPFLLGSESEAKGVWGTSFIPYPDPIPVLDLFLFV